MEQITPTIDDGAKAPRRPKIMEGPKLQHLKAVSRILRAGEEGPLGEEQSWWELAENVKPWKSGLELSDNIRSVLVDFVSKKIPALQEEITRLPELSEKQFIEALANNWFEGIAEEVGGKRQEVLLTIMAHIVKRIETVMVKKIIQNASDEQLDVLGLEHQTRDLLTGVLDMSSKADPLYVRFMAYSQQRGPDLSLDQIKELCGGTEDDDYYEQLRLFVLPLSSKSEDGNAAVSANTLATLFPREVQYISQHIDTLLASADQWKSLDGGDLFRQYLGTLKDFHTAIDPKDSMTYHQQAEELYTKLIRTSFPIMITPSGDPFYRATSLDPELKVSLATRDAGSEEQSWLRARDTLSECLDVVGASQWAERIKEQPVRGVMALGAFGVNLNFNSVAQAQESAIIVFINEQVRAYDREFPGVLYRYIKNADALFGAEVNSGKTDFLERLSRIMTPLHELSHGINYHGQEGLSGRLGAEQLAILDEVKAEICFRPIVPEMIQKGGLEGTKEEWAAGMIASSLIVLRDSAEKTDYWYAASYSMNALFEQGAIVLRDKQIDIVDVDMYYEIQKNAARALLAVYDDPAMTPGKAKLWIKKNCMPNEYVRVMAEYVSAEEI